MSTWAYLIVGAIIWASYVSIGRSFDRQIREDLRNKPPKKRPTPRHPQDGIYDI